MRHLILASAFLTLAAFGAHAQNVGVGGISNPPGLNPNGGDASATTVRATGVSAPYAASLANLAAQSGVLLDTFAQSGDADDTASMTRAVAAGVPILLGPRTYTINNFSTGAVAQFILRGIPGASVIQRTAASGSHFFSIAATSVYIDGVTFDSNKASVTANQWGVLMNAGGQTVFVQNSKFENNSGTIGSCFAMLGTGPAAGGGVTFKNNEVTGCTFDSVYFGSVTNGVVDGNYVHDNTGLGIFAGSYLSASSTNYLSNFIISHNRSVRNTTNIAIGGFGPPYTYGTPSAVNVLSEANWMQDASASSYNLSMQGDHLQSVADVITAATTTALGGIDCNSRYVSISLASINLPGSGYGIDCGGAVQASIQTNTVTMTSGTALDVGGTQYSIVQANTLNLSGTAIGAVIYEVEGDGSGNAFPTIQSGLTLQDNIFNISGSSATGIDLFDNAGGRTGSFPTLILNNKFNVSGSGSGPFQDITYFGGNSSIVIQGNYHNGTTTTFSDPQPDGDVQYDNVWDGVQGVSSTASIRSFVPIYIATYGAGGSILYVETATGGSGYVATTTTMACSGTGGGSGWVGTASINAGVILGVKTTAHGSGYSGTLSCSATDTSGGTGATFTVSNIPQLPGLKDFYWNDVAGNLIEIAGGYISISGLGGAFPMGPNQRLSLRSAGGFNWQVVASLPVSTAPTISSGFGTGASRTVSNGPLSFNINVGTGGAASTGVIGLPTASTGWTCSVTDITSKSAAVSSTQMTASTTNTATIGNFTDISTSGPWNAGDNLRISCTPQ